ncbi:MAG: hypothetical protein EWV55_16560 [Microcystis viridis Mv_BB_P_19951000_S69]|uniref:Uncharacterized protein n=1 Tax=Microcystis viridis Mv_BB_P_19951000_S68D TaxID=2486270 RepID=A0A552HKJ4_MICVR|nr:MAG: hypothetical protein EWV47_20610 [Microcystis viridis Mv_BB_P_19951000_S68]TRU71650.1 MAG: hypothetical protein EWV55_16560 [Microcystis viridis Mv_BB_P_19951000_S69]TRU71697.1 MAG: hypothetical protein EWV77_14910 [Microcystis viridis Mv_BB_P_19951000_S68D]TRU81387.1 MAG: hypothetical protein EWV46_21120 [Microcystis viridis Mv_BB_P_19951000_S69D]
MSFRGCFCRGLPLKKVPHSRGSVKLNLYYTKSCLQGMGERGETIHNLGVHRTIKNRFILNPLSTG